MAIKYKVKCNKCGNTRETYNDPRLRRSVIECKASCFESHYEWAFVDEFDEASPVLAAPPPLANSPQVAPSNKPNGNKIAESDQSPSSSPPVGEARQAFVTPVSPPAANTPASATTSSQAANGAPATPVMIPSENVSDHKTKKKHWCTAL
jgi:hypothetical protein